MNKIARKQNLRQTQAEERRLQILDTALTTFSARGFNGTSIKNIAEAAGISQGLMYHYFRSKEDLLESTVEHYSFVPQLQHMLEGARKRPINEVFVEIAIEFLEMLDNRAKIIKLFMQAVDTNPMVKNAWASLVHRGVSLIDEYLQSQIASGELKSHNTEITARCLFGILFTYHFTSDVFGSSKISREEYVKVVLDNLLNGISKK
jgi:AcrR family transcriptional regulator